MGQYIDKDVKYRWLERFYLSLDFAGTITTAFQVLDKHDFVDYTCGEDDNASYQYEKDVAKMLFWSAMTFRLTLLPLSHHLLKKLRLNHYPDDNEIHLCEKMILESVKSIFFVIMTAQQFDVNAGVYAPLSLLTVWPLFLLYYKKKHPSFSQGSYPEYRKYFEDDTKTAVLFSLGEGVHNALSLAGTCGLLSSFLFNIFYDASHNNDWSHQNKTVGALVLVGLSVGGFTQLKTKLYDVTHISQAVLDIFYFCFINMASSLACISPDKFTPEGFRKSGWQYSVGFALVSVIIASGAVFVSRNNPFGEQEHAVSHQGHLFNGLLRDRLIEEGGDDHDVVYDRSSQSEIDNVSPKSNIKETRIDYVK